MGVTFGFHKIAICQFSLRKGIGGHLLVRLLDISGSQRLPLKKPCLIWWHCSYRQCYPQEGDGELNVDGREVKVSVFVLGQVHGVLDQLLQVVLVHPEQVDKVEEGAGAEGQAAASAEGQGSQAHRQDHGEPSDSCHGQVSHGFRSWAGSSSHHQPDQRLVSKAAKGQDAQPGRDANHHQGTVSCEEKKERKVYFMAALFIG